MSKLLKSSPIVVVVAICLIVFLSFSSSLFRTTTPSNDHSNERLLEEVLESIEGVGRVKIYYDPQQKATESSLAQYFSMPENEQSEGIQGILVVAEGGGNPKIQSVLSKAIATIFQLKEHQIVIVEMKIGEELE